MWSRETNLVVCPAKPPETPIPRAEPGRFVRAVSRMDGDNKLQFPSLPVTKEELLVSLLAAC